MPVDRASEVTVILLEGLRFRGRHGVLAEERKLGGPFRVDLALDILSPPRWRDRLSETLDYRSAFARTKALMEGRPFRTLEALADTLAVALIRLPKVRRARVRITKLAPPFMPGATSAVEIARTRGEVR
ncbi:MAG: dihydroneopterin aldolase [Candidatus Coatesbacteria bacterium]